MLICTALLQRRLILHYVLATKTRQAPTKNNIKCLKHILAGRHSSKGLPNDICEISTMTNFANVVKKKPLIDLKCLRQDHSSFCFRLGYVLELGLVSQLGLVCFSSFSATGDIIVNTVEHLYCGYHGTTAVCPDYRGVRISEVSGIFSVGVAMHTSVVECYEGAF